MINENFRVICPDSPLPCRRRRRRLVRGEAVRAQRPQPCWSETGLVVQPSWRGVTVQWTSGQITTVPARTLSRIHREPVNV